MALGILMIGVGAAIVLVGRDTGGFLPRASEDTIPKQVRITNITDSGFSVSFLTDAASAGYIKYGEQNNQLNVQVADDRDQLTSQTETSTTHHITVRGLQPGTQYYFQIGTGSRELFDNNGQPFSLRTAARLQNPGEAKTAYGSVSNQVGNPASGALIYLSMQGASPLSALVKQNGSWAVPISTVRTTDLSGPFPLTDSTPVRIQVQGTARTETIDYTTTVGNLSPLPTLTFGQTPQEAPTPATTGTQSTGTASQLGGINVNQVDQATPVQITSIEEGETINTDQPEFSGKAPPNTQLQIEVHSSHTFTATITSDAQGAWNWSPPGNLEPGEHSVIISYVDSQGATQRVTRNFVVQAGSTSLPAFTATPSATVATPTPTPLAVATPTPTPVPTPEPTPLSTPTPVVVVPDTTAEQPVSGAAQPVLSLLGLSTLFFGVGALGAKSIFPRRGRRR